MFRGGQKENWTRGGDGGLQTKSDVSATEYRRVGAEGMPPVTFGSSLVLYNSYVPGYWAITREMVRMGSSIAMAMPPMSTPMKPIITGSMNWVVVLMLARRSSSR